MHIGNWTTLVIFIGNILNKIENYRLFTIFEKFQDEPWDCSNLKNTFLKENIRITFLNSQWNQTKSKINFTRIVPFSAKIVSKWISNNYGISHQYPMVSWGSF